MFASTTEAAIQRLLADIFYDQDISSLDTSESLANRGLLDSLVILRLVTLCEETFGITIPGYGSTSRTFRHHPYHHDTR